MNNAVCEIDERLATCASFVRHGAICADIGSDHAYLPIYLVKHGICPRAIASDINEGPVNRAKINIALSNLSDKIDVLLANGLDEATEYHPDDIVIAGMGGELIRDIVNASEYVKNKSVRLILQPMTMPEALRKYLASTGFSIIDEKVCVAAGKCYVVICAEYGACKYELSEAEYCLGPVNLNRIRDGRGTKEDIELLKKTSNSARKRILGMSRSTHPNAEITVRDTELYELCEELLCNYKEV